ncbi:uncharacterized protein Z520_03476 [Fonsecaea multimorphosa CBS 102226]|uniref:Uncharacterized protein n=1 Tax=Fonsecaea multimorphosa CBS 102226 TaxID=1442371 RepID=A0A0D2KCE6_9EURO|nr:uncharacterized protein Z520_03476 [Fonsecaea multimorphosa CBS 102226]KIY00810.1 hypothetical protein Z520_03476 [Fonsecaea multimorphosa CBS 102226]OAL27909.1 hypothetical protein AYO22_03254 [Fonsecaea multimorphosa]
MWEKLRAFFKRDRSSQPSKHRRQSDPLGNLSEVAAPAAIENRSDSAIYHHHTLEEDLERSLRGEDIDAETPEDEILFCPHTLEENLELAKEHSQERKRQSQELRRLPSDRHRAQSSGE